MKYDQVIAERSNKTVYRDGDKCVKVFVEGFPKSNVFNEALNHARIEEGTDLKIPHVLEVTTTDGRWTLIADYIEGKTLAQMMKENPEQKDEYLEQFVDLQLYVQSMRCPVLGQLKDKMNDLIRNSGLDATTRYELHMRLEGMPTHRKICHGDFYPSNVVIAKDGTAYILDWAHATQGNASADAAVTYLRFCLHGEEEMAKKYLDLFCLKSDTARQYVQKWMPIAAAAESVEAAEKDKAFLLSWANVVEYE